MHENESSARRLTAKANRRRVSLEAIITIPIKNLFNFSENYNNITNFDIMGIQFSMRKIFLIITFKFINV